MRQAILGLPTLLIVLAYAVTVLAYIPAVPTNDTSNLAQSDDLLHLAFYNGPFSVFTANVARQLLAEGFGDDGNYTNTSAVVPWTRYSKGVLIHFDETLRNQPPAAVPWLAMINCDTNGTSFSDVDDIFTICRDLGAQAALLYSLTAQGCEINEEYLGYEKVLDVYATTSLQNARIIENQFGNVNSSAWHYSSEALNSSATLIEALLANNALSVVGNIPVNATSTDDSDDAEATAPSVFDPDTPPAGATTTDTDDSPTSTDPPSLFGSSGSTNQRNRRFGKRQATATSSPSARTTARTTRTSASPSPTVAINYLGAVIAGANMTVGGASSSAPSASPTSDRNRGPNTGLAMIILYAITGVVTFLFFTVIACGAVRAIRYPERYGPRAGFGYGNRASGPGGSGGGAQNRAQGLARAVLDTFPVVRFGGTTTTEGETRRGDEEAGGTGDGEGKKESGKGGNDAIELTQLAPVLSAVPKARRTETDATDITDEMEEIGQAPSMNATDREVRRSISTNSFQSAVSTPDGLARNDSSFALLSSPAPTTILPPSTIDLPSPTSLEGPASSLSPVVPTTIVPPIPSGTPNGDEDQPSCPICVCDFASGDSIRILPCDGRHQFHVECIDPWLLEVSRLCPLCRLDLGENHQATTSGTNPTGEVATRITTETYRTNEEDEVEAREARERERERHEEERVVRHLRGLLNRGSTSNSLVTQATASGGPAGRRRGTRAETSGVAPGDILSGDQSSTGEGVEGVQRARETSGLRSRFANYVAAKRTRRRGSTSAGAGTSNAGLPGPIDISW